MIRALLAGLLWVLFCMAMDIDMTTEHALLTLAIVVAGGLAGNWGGSSNGGSKTD